MDGTPQSHSVSGPLSRRRFLRNAAIAAGSVAALQVGGPGVARLAAAEATGTLPHDGAITGVVRTSDGALAIGHDDKGAVKVWRRADSDDDWTRSSVEGDFDQATVLGLAAAGGGFVAVGYREQRTEVGTATGEGGQSVPIVDLDLSPAAWTSDDGTTWQRADTPDASAALVDVASSPDGMLAVGATLDGETTEGEAPLVLASGDGRSWTAVDATGLPETPEGGLQAVAYRGREWFALSLDFEGAALWTSSDGASWSAHSSFPAGEAPAGLGDGPGGLVAVGATMPDLEPRYWQVTGNGVAEQPLPSEVAAAGAPAVLHDAVEAQRGGRVLLVGEQHGRALATEAKS